MTFERKLKKMTRMDKFVVRPKYYPKPRAYSEEFQVNPAYSHLTTRTLSKRSVSKGVAKPASSQKSRNSPRPNFMPKPPDNHIGNSKSLNNSNNHYKVEDNRHSKSVDRAEPSTSYQIQSGSSFPRSMLKNTKTSNTDVLVYRTESKNIRRDFTTLKRRSAPLDYNRAPSSYNRTYTLCRTPPRKSYGITPIRIPKDQIKYKRSLANSIAISSQIYLYESIIDLTYYYQSPIYHYYLRLPPIEFSISPPPSPAPNPNLFYGQSYIPSDDLYYLDRYPQYNFTRTNPANPLITYREPKEEDISDEERETIRFGYSPTSPSLFFPCENYKDWYYNSWKRCQSTRRMNSLDHERKIIIEFCHLLEKSKELFNGLRYLPQYGHKQWHSYFGRTFDVYTKLWEFQQKHRQLLDRKYGLKRFQIGDIALKIGQLYYHLYISSCQIKYLNEAYSFYHAIRDRCYYGKSSEELNEKKIIIKKLRYYESIMMVSLLLKKIKFVRELAKELERQVIEYINIYEPSDQLEWTVLVDEVKAFIQAEEILKVFDADNYCVTLSHRLGLNTIPPLEKTTQMTLSMQEVLIVGNSAHQVKFFELTMDMFRILQTLEREPSADAQQLFEESPRPCAPTTKGLNLDGYSRRDNPHKYLLFEPTPSQVLVYLASGCHDLPPAGALLLYISADGQIIKSTQHTDDGYNMGGVITTSKINLHQDCKDSKNAPPKFKKTQCLYPGDLYPYTRKPMFLIVDSDNSYVFQEIPNSFGQPLVILMSPLEIPSQYHDRRHQGNLFTLFLYSPLTAICYCCEIQTISLGKWERAQSYVENFMIEVSQLIMSHCVDLSYISFMKDDFLRVLVVRYLFCYVSLRNLKVFKTRNQLPRAMPALPEKLLEHPTLLHIILDLAAYLQVRNYFVEPSTGPSSSKTE